MPLSSPKEATVTETMLPDALRAAGEVDLHGLAGVREDDMVEYVHSGLERLPGYLELYARYLKQRWDVYELDFTQDRYDWHERMGDAERAAMLIASGRFMHGERAVEVTLAPLLLGGTEEQKIYLTSQIEDEARHVIFFERFRREAIGFASASVDEALDGAYEEYHYGGEAIFNHALLAQLGHCLARDPQDMHNRVRYATVYFFWTEGVRALSTFQLLLNYCRESNVLPGFYTGLIATTRDESRHVQFGLRLLHDAIHADPTLVADVHEALRTLVSINAAISLETFNPEALGWTTERARQTVIRNLYRKLDCIGVRLPDDIETSLGYVQAGLGE